MRSKADDTFIIEILFELLQNYNANVEVQRSGKTYSNNEGVETTSLEQDDAPGSNSFHQ